MNDRTSSCAIQLSDRPQMRRGLAKFTQDLLSRDGPRTLTQPPSQPHSSPAYHIVSRAQHSGGRSTLTTSCIDKVEGESNDLPILPRMAK